MQEQARKQFAEDVSAVYSAFTVELHKPSLRNLLAERPATFRANMRRLLQKARSGLLTEISVLELLDQTDNRRQRPIRSLIPRRTTAKKIVNGHIWPSTTG
ncbi:hypothetical protein [Phaeospirillum tilakii]|uniref:Uncharacterized protein n=1 Tax=Phaeospirillum tilakii TaxID=741673 RepID=A0ABW5C674_9PROT